VLLYIFNILLQSTGAGLLTAKGFAPGGGSFFWANEFEEGVSRSRIYNITKY
jgi:hypothetical protein